MKEFPKIRRISDSKSNIFISDTDVVYILEKIDGANFRWGLHQGDDGVSIVTGSRRVKFTQEGEPLPIEEINKNFRHTVEYLQRTVPFDELVSVYEEYGELVFFGESLHKHTVDYEAWKGYEPDIQSDVPNFIGFDIWSVDENSWLRHSEVESIYARLQLESVPIIHTTTVGELSDSHLEIPQSEFREKNLEAKEKFNREGLAEGIIVKNDTRGTRAKKVSEYMAEVNQFGKPKNEETLEEMKERKRNGTKFTEMFITEQRVLKQAYKLVDEGEYEALQMEMMEKLPQRVLTDVFEEEGWSFITNEYKIEFTEASKEEIRQQASKRCSRILQEEISAS